MSIFGTACYGSTLSVRSFGTSGFASSAVGSLADFGGLVG